MEEDAKKTKKDALRSKTLWAGAENALAEGTFSGYAMGVIETEKVLGKILEEKRIPGKNTDAKINYIRKYLSLPEKLDKAREIFCRLTGNFNASVNQEETKEAIADYWQAVKDIEEAFSALSAKQKFYLKTRHWGGRLFRFSKRSAVDVAVFLALILFLYDTETGRDFSARVGRGAHVLVFNILPWVFGTVLGVLILIFVWKLLNKKKNKF